LYHDPSQVPVPTDFLLLFEMVQDGSSGIRANRSLLERAELSMKKFVELRENTNARFAVGVFFADPSPEPIESSSKSAATTTSPILLLDFTSSVDAVFTALNRVRSFVKLTKKSSKENTKNKEEVFPVFSSPRATVDLLNSFASLPPSAPTFRIPELHNKGSSATANHSYSSLDDSNSSTRCRLAFRSHANKHLVLVTGLLVSTLPSPPAVFSSPSPSPADLFRVASRLGELNQYYRSSHRSSLSISLLFKPEFQPALDVFGDPSLASVYR
jgi:hypothetical protein